MASSNDGLADAASDAPPVADAVAANSPAEVDPVASELADAEPDAFTSDALDAPLTPVTTSAGAIAATTTAQPSLAVREPLAAACVPAVPPSLMAKIIVTSEPSCWPIATMPV